MLCFRSFMLWLKRRNSKEETDRPQYIKDHDLSTLEDHFLFWDYLEIGKTTSILTKDTYLGTGDTT